MAMVEIRLAPADVSARLDHMRRWLAGRGCGPVKFTSTGSSNETVLIVEFALAEDATAFANEFSGILLGS